MKRLVLIRHAKSSWKHPGLTDFQRPLNSRGRRDAPQIGRWMETQGYLPELVLCSAAIRTKETLELMRGVWTTQPQIEYCDELYHAEPDVISEVIRMVDDSIQSVMIVAHNPGLETMIGGLRGEFEEWPTAAVAVFELDILGWDTFGWNSRAKLLAKVIPADLEDVSQ